MHKLLGLGLFTLLTSCVWEGTSDEPLVVEPEDQPLIGVPVSLEADAELQLVLYREGPRGAWKPAESAGPRRYQVRVRGPYTVMAVCTWGGSPVTYLVSRSLSDSRTISFPCVLGEWPLTVSGSMVQPGRVSIGEASQSSTAANWSFQLPATAGTYDAIATNNQRVAVQRAVEVSEDRTLPAFDLATQGTALLDVPFTVTNPIPGQALEAVAWMITPRQRQAQIYRGGISPLKVAPSSLLLPGERQEVTVRSTSYDGAQLVLHSVRRPFQLGDSTEVTLWRPFSSYDLGVDASGDLVATWASDERMDGVEVNASSDTAFLEHTASDRYLRETGVKSLTLETDVPGYQNAWRVDFVAPHDRSLFTRKDSLGAGFQYNEFFDALAGQRAPRQAGVRRPGLGGPRLLD